MASGLVRAAASKAASSSSSVSSRAGEMVPLSGLELRGVVSPIPRTADNGQRYEGSQRLRAHTWKDKVCEESLREIIQSGATPSEFVERNSAMVVLMARRNKL